MEYNLEYKQKYLKYKKKYLELRKNINMKGGANFEVNDLPFNEFMSGIISNIINNENITPDNIQIIINSQLNILLDRTNTKNDYDKLLNLITDFEFNDKKIIDFLEENINDNRYRTIRDVLLAFIERIKNERDNIDNDDNDDDGNDNNDDDGNDNNDDNGDNDNNDNNNDDGNDDNENMNKNKKNMNKNNDNIKK